MLVTWKTVTPMWRRRHMVCLPVCLGFFIENGSIIRSFAMMTSSNGSIFRFRGIHWSPVNLPHKGQWRGALMFSLICAWTNGCTNNPESDDLRQHHAYCDVTVMTAAIIWLNAQAPVNLSRKLCVMMTSSNGNILRVTGPSWGEPPVTSGFPWQRPVMRNFDVFYDVRRNKRLITQSRCQWFETPWRSLWRHCNAKIRCYRETTKPNWCHQSPGHHQSSQCGIKVISLT